MNVEERVNVTPCEECDHHSVCKMKREYERFVQKAGYVQDTRHEDGSRRFPDFLIEAQCGHFKAKRTTTREA